MFSSNSSQVSSAVSYIEDVMSTYLYTGTGAALTITNGIDTTTYGGLTWIKSRSGTTFHRLTDTARGVTKSLATNDNGGTATETTGLTAFGTTGFTIGADADYNTSAATYVSWTFREQPKFFDVVTYTGTGTAHAINHNLGSVPGFIIVKSTSVAGSWYCYHRGTNGGVNPQNYGMSLNSTAAQLAYINFWNNTAPTATQFTVGDAGGETNETGVSYIAYLFAHDAGGFGLAGTDNVISCGSYTGNALFAGPVVTLGYEPQWVLVKRTDSTGNWILQDNMRSLSQTNTDQLFPNLSNVATTGAYPTVVPTATGFYIGDNGTGYNASGGTYIYIAIRRGPMKVPTLGTSVFDVDTLTPAANLIGTKVTNPFATDLLITTQRDHAGLPSTYAVDRLRGGSASVATNSTGAEQDWGTTYSWKFDYNDGFLDNFAYPQGTVTTPMIYWSFKRAPGFFDEVCYTGTGSATTVTHNLGVVPELIITKSRSTLYSPAWGVYHAALGNTKYLNFLSSSADINASYWNDTTPTGSVFTVNSNGAVNASGATYVAYLFATCAGVSKVGSYTGNGTTQTIDCGFGAGGARFVLIKRTDDTGDWYVYDTARGMTVLTDPYLLLNTTAAEVATLGSVTTVSTGFALNSTILAAINISAGTYIFLAIA